MAVSDRGGTICQVLGRALRLAGYALLLLLVLGGLMEAFFRWRGMQPQNLYRIGFTATVLDRWTEWAMRPNVRLNEYAVTNAFGLHEDREINLDKPANTPRVAVVGSSVTWGLGEPLENTIPRSAERELRKAGCGAEVLNFAGQGYNILNASAYVQTKIHQFHPDAVVVIMDLQMAFPHFPTPSPIQDEQAVIRRLGFFEGIFKRATEHSVVLTMLDNTSLPREILSKHLPFAVELKAPPAPRASAGADLDGGPAYLARFLAWGQSRVGSVLDRLKAEELGQGAVVRPAPAIVRDGSQAPSAPAYEARRERELGSLVAGLSAFARQMGFDLYFVTPYGPYFHAGPEDYKKFSLGMLSETVPVYGGIAAAAQREAELASTIIARHAVRNGARVVDMLPLTREGTMGSGDFSTDGIHFSAQGYRRVGSILAERLLKDGLCGGKPPRPKS